MKYLATWLVLSAVLVSPSADAKRRRRRAPPASSATKVPVAPATELTDEALAKKTPEEVLAAAQALYDQLEYDRVIPLAKMVLGREGVSRETRLDAYLLQGSALAIIDPIDAETPFRLLLEYRRDFDMPPDTPPKILAVFRKVKVEVDAIHFEETRMARVNTIKGLALKGAHPGDTDGGLPIIFAYGLNDKTGAVDTVSVQYRKSGEKNFSALALKQGDDGRFKGAIPGDFTANDAGFALEYFIVTADDVGDLLVVGGATEPLSLNVAPGEKTTPYIPPVPVWGFASGAVAASALTGLWAVMGVAWAAAQADYLIYVNRDLQPFEIYSGGVDGGDLITKQRNGWIIAVGANVTAFVAALAWSAVLVTGVWFTNWADEKPPEY